MLPQKGDTEAERQGEILAFYGEEEARTCGSPNPGPAVEKDNTAMKPAVKTEEKVRFLGIRKPLCTESLVINTGHSMVVQVLFKKKCMRFVRVSTHKRRDECASLAKGPALSLFIIIIWLFLLLFYYYYYFLECLEALMKQSLLVLLKTKDSIYYSELFL